MSYNQNQPKNSGNFASDPQRAASTGQKGGQSSGGNFANDPNRASEAGRKGGQSTQQGSVSKRAHSDNE